MFGILKSIFSTDINNLSYTKAFAKALEAEHNSDYELAVKLYEVVIEKGFYEHKAYAYNNLAILYKNGYGTNKNINKAKELFKEALNGGLHKYGYNPSTILNIKYFDNSESYKCPHDNKKALEKCIKLAKSGDVELQYQLHDVYESGIYVDENYEESQYWFNMAANNGHERALITIKVDKERAEEDERDEKAIREAERGDFKGLYDLAIMILHYRKSEDYEGE